MRLIVGSFTSAAYIANAALGISVNIATKYLQIGGNLTMHYYTIFNFLTQIQLVAVS